MTTRFLDEVALPEPPEPGEAARRAARSLPDRHGIRSDGTVWTALETFRTTSHEPGRRLLLRDEKGTIHEVVVEPADVESSAGVIAAVEAGLGVTVLNTDHPVAANTTARNHAIELPRRLPEVCFVARRSKRTRDPAVRALQAALVAGFSSPASNGV